METNKELRIKLLTLGLKNDEANLNNGFILYCFRMDATLLDLARAMWTEESHPELFSKVIPIGKVYWQSNYDLLMSVGF